MGPGCGSPAQREGSAAAAEAAERTGSHGELCVLPEKPASSSIYHRGQAGGDASSRF